MALEITGKVQQVLEVQRGEGRNGPWQKGGFVLEMGDNFPKSVCCTAWGDLIGPVQALQPGEMVKASIDLQSREYNGRWYTDVKVWRLEKLTTEPIETSGPEAPTPEPPVPSKEQPAPETPNNTEDDLPF